MAAPWNMSKSHEVRYWRCEYGKQYLVSGIISYLSKAWKIVLPIDPIVTGLGIDSKEMWTKTFTYACLFSITYSKHRKSAIPKMWNGDKNYSIFLSWNTILPLKVWFRRLPSDMRKHSQNKCEKKIINTLGSSFSYISMLISEKK